MANPKKTQAMCTILSLYVLKKNSLNPLSLRVKSFTYLLHAAYEKSDAQQGLIANQYW